MHLRLLTKTLTSFSILIFAACNSGKTEKKVGNRDTNFAATFDSLQRRPLKDTSIKGEGKVMDTTAETPKNEIKEETVVVDSAKKYVFLTFDDGPQPGTMNVYHNLRALGIKGTFFMVGLHATYGKDMREAVDTIRDNYPNVQLANHSYTHANGRYFSFYHHVADCFADFMKAQKSLDVQEKFIRLPGNSGWVLATGMLAHPLVKPVCNLLDSAGYNVIGWDVEWQFKTDKVHGGSIPVETPGTMVKMVEYALNHHRTHRKNAVVLLSHDRMFHHQNYSDSLYKFMKLLKERNPNYIFETVDHYPGAKVQQ